MEFLWQEGHTCHATSEEALKETMLMLSVYENFLKETFAIAVVPGEKTASEKFAGAEKTFCVEAMMQDKKALQAATSHYFGTKFAEAFEIKYQDAAGKLQFVHQTSWGISTRIIGALIMVHSDDQGLVLPPNAAPTQIVIIPITQKGKDNAKVNEVSEQLYKSLSKKYSCILDNREEYSMGYKFNEYEIQGIPLRIEVGPRDLANNKAMLSRRDGVKNLVYVEQIEENVPVMLEEFQKALYEKSKNYITENTFIEDDYKKFEEKIEQQGGFYQMHWCGSGDCENHLKDKNKATIRCIPLKPIKENGKCIVCQKPSTQRVIIARSY
jgi:prolyl-tRNA synthetase